MLARLIAIAMLAVVNAPASARAKEISPQLIACHDYATRRYIANFRQVGLPEKHHDEASIVVTVFQNDNPKFEEYLAECMKRWDKEDR